MNLSGLTVFPAAVAVPGRGEEKNTRKATVVRWRLRNYNGRRVQ